MASHSDPDSDTYERAARDALTSYTRGSPMLALVPTSYQVRTRHAVRAWTLGASVFAFALSGCESCAHEETSDAALDTPEPPRHVSFAEAILPDDAALSGGARMRFVEGDPHDVAVLADVATCESCHAEVARAWRGSAHAHASFDNPWYRQSAEAFRAEREGPARNFCGGCHEPLLFLSGALEGELDLGDPLARRGVTCMVCHGAREALPDGNASLVLSSSPPLLPVIGNDASEAAHARAMRPEALTSAALCGACHRSFAGPEMGNPHHFAGIDDLGAWQRSGYAGSAAARLDDPVEAQTCQGCHMPEVSADRRDFAALRDGLVHSHRFAGAHTALGAALQDDAQVRASEEMLRRAATIDIGAIRSARGVRLAEPDTEVEAGEEIELDVVIRNVGAGHAFPGGTRDAQDTWVELVVSSARGARLAQVGLAHARDPEAPAHQLRTWVVDGEGHVDRRHLPQRFRAGVADRTLGPRAAAALRVSVALPDTLTRGDFPLRVDVRLLHRRHEPTLHRAACEASRAAPALRRAMRAAGERAIDGCLAQPMTELARAAITLGNGASDADAEGGAAAPRFARLFALALALTGELSEHVEDAWPVALAAREAALGDARHRAMAIALLARVRERQGRPDEAIALADEAEAELGAPHPALDRLRADALARVWRWAEAVPLYARVAERAPLDEGAWAALARARASAGDDVGALHAARRALGLEPRHESALRSQGLALTALRAPGADAARRAHDDFRAPDDAQLLRDRCDREEPGCSQARVPVPRLRAE